MDKQKSMSLKIVRKFFSGVTNVRDAKGPATIEITETDNKKAVPLDHEVCALAIACKRSLQADGVLIGVKTAYIIHGHTATRYRLNETTAREIVSFDRHAGFFSGSYTLRAPCESDRIESGQPKGKTSNKTGRKVGIRHITANIRTRLGTRAQ